MCINRSFLSDCPLPALNWQFVATQIIWGTRASRIQWYEQGVGGEEFYWGKERRRFQSLQFSVQGKG